MGQTFSQLNYHIVFSTKDRMPYLNEDIRRDLLPYLGGIVRGIRGCALRINSVPDHVHMLVRLPTDLCIADAVRTIKANSSKWIHESRRTRRAFSWQGGYSAFTVSESNLRDVGDYIDRQEEHHRRISFQEELLAFLKAHNIPYNERYIWT